MPDRTLQESISLTGTFAARSTQSTVDYRVLVPPDLRPDERLPLLLHLHGAMSSAERSLDVAKPVYDDAWRRGVLPKAVVACATTPTRDGFYIDQPGGPHWETLIAREFPEVLAQRFLLSNVRALIGSSMGGYGALKAAFRAPEGYVAVAALSPAIFPGETAAAVPAGNLPLVLADLHRAMGADEGAYHHNSVHALARAHRHRILDAGLGIFLECGDADEFGLHDGALFLDQLLTACALPHEFHSTAHSGHLDTTGGRLAGAVAFLGPRLMARRSFSGDDHVIEAAH